MTEIVINKYYLKTKGGESHSIDKLCYNGYALNIRGFSKNNYKYYENT
jgi:hypothetical protein